MHRHDTNVSYHVHPEALTVLRSIKVTCRVVLSQLTVLEILPCSIWCGNLHNQKITWHPQGGSRFQSRPVSIYILPIIKSMKTSGGELDKFIHVWQAEKTMQLRHHLYIYSFLESMKVLFYTHTVLACVWWLLWRFCVNHRRHREFAISFTINSEIDMTHVKLVVMWITEDSYTIHEV